MSRPVVQVEGEAPGYACPLSLHWLLPQPSIDIPIIYLALVDGIPRSTKEMVALVLTVLSFYLYLSIYLSMYLLQRSADITELPVSFVSSL